MCGIFAYLNYDVEKKRSEVLEILFNGLRRLEYRGYDSAGVSIDSDLDMDVDLAILTNGSAGNGLSGQSVHGPPLVFREEGKIDNLVAKVAEDTVSVNLDVNRNLSRHVGIAHTRWATHGEPSPRNSHPQTSGEGNDFVVVHNGIITNHKVLRETLQRHGFVFESDTDTEVIPKLAKFVYDTMSNPSTSPTTSPAPPGFSNGKATSTPSKILFTQVVMEVMRQLEGAYALLFKSRHFPNELVACKRGSPLLLGVRVPDEGYLSAFDLAAVAEEESVTAADDDDSSSTSSAVTGSERNQSGRESGVPSAALDGQMNGSLGRVSGRGQKRAKELFLASDASAVVEHTRKVMVIEDNEVVHIRNGVVSLYKFDPDKTKRGHIPSSLQRALSTLEMEVAQIMKGGYEHFMQKEIHEQPESLTTTMRGRLIPGDATSGTGAASQRRITPTNSSTSVPSADGIASAAPGGGISAVRSREGGLTASPSSNSRGGKEKGVLLGGLKQHLRTIRRSRRIIIVGCGTSFHAALACRQLVEELSGVPVQLELASDLIDRRAPIYREDTAVFLSQSGETADTLLALEYARSAGALCVGVTNTVGSAIARGTDCGVFINAGAEIGVASTKAYTSQIAVLTMIALALGEDSISSRERREQIIDGLLGLPEKVREVLKLDEEMKELARELQKEQSLLVFGRGYNYATAIEAALKVKEVALMHSEGILAGEMKHGPLALVDENLPIIVIATKDSTCKKQQSVIQQLQARRARLIVMCTEGGKEEMCPNGAARVIEVPWVEDCLQPIINIIPLQLLAYHLTVLRGYNVDQPRNLAKSVTVE